MFLLGAGISMGNPTNLPSGNELKDILINSLFDKNTISKKLQNKLLENKIYKEIVPEIILQNVFQHIDTKLFQFYEFLRFASRNSNHLLFEILSKKHTILTTNFELLIEDNKLNENVLHLHGDLNHPMEMTMLINKVGKGVDRVIRKNTLSKLKNKNLYVFGYSGNDKDIMDILSVSEVETIYWLLRKKPDNQFYRNIKNLSKKDVKIFVSNLKNVVSDIASKFKLNVSTIKSPAKKKIEQRLSVLENFKSNLETGEKIESIQRIFTQLRDYNSSLKIAIKAVRQRTTSNWIHVALIDNLRILGKYDECYSRIDFAFHLNVEKRQQRRFLANLHNLKGLTQINDDSLTEKERYKDSMLDFDKAEKILLKHIIGTEESDLEYELSSILLARVYNNKGLIHNELKNYKSAIINYKKSIKIKKRIGDIVGISYSVLNITFTYNHMKSYSNFHYWKNRFFELVDKFNFIRLKAYYYREIGMDRCKFGHIKTGVEYLELAKEIYENDVNIKSELKTTLELIEKYKYCG